MESEARWSRRVTGHAGPLAFRSTGTGDSRPAGPGLSSPARQPPSSLGGMAPSRGRWLTAGEFHLWRCLTFLTPSQEGLIPRLGPSPPPPAAVTGKVLCQSGTPTGIRQQEEGVWRRVLTPLEEGCRASEVTH